MARRDNPELAKSSLAGAAAQDVQTSVFGTEGAQLSAVEKAQKDRLTVYQKALAEGVMTPDEFHTRTLTNLREAINKNPGLERELRNEASRVLELSGITGVLKVDQEIAQSKQKQEEKAWEDMQGRAKREHIYYDSSTPKWKLAEQVQAAENDTRSYNLQVREKERFSMATAAQARQWNDEKGPEVVRGSISNNAKILVQMVEEKLANGQTMDATSYPKFKAEVEDTLDQQHQIFVSSIPASIRQDPNSQDLIKMHADSMEKLKTRLSTMASGEDIKKVILNEVEIAKGTQDRDIRKNYNVAEIDLMGNLLRYAPGAVIESSDVMDKFKGIIKNIASGNYKAPVMKEVLPKSDQDKFSGVVIQSALSAGEKVGSWQELTRSLTAMNNATSLAESPKQRLQFLFNNLSTLAKSKPQQMDADTINQVDVSVGQMLEDTNFGINSLTETSKGKDVSMDVLSSGMLVFTGKDAPMFNKVYANNVNVALQAYANAHNMSMKEAAKEFYPKYFSGLVGE
jgi:Mor family transcriptional regulator